MNPIQIGIIAFVVIVILLTLAYYWYDDIKFKRKVEDNFNQATRDILNEDRSVVLDGLEHGAETIPNKILHKDIEVLSSNSSDPLLGDFEKIETKAAPAPALAIEEEFVEPQPTEPVPEDSAEAFFVKLDKIEFDYKGLEIKRDLDLIVDIVFEDSAKLKILPEITQFTHKHFVFYVLDKDNTWSEFEKGKKYVAKALKLVVQLVDKEGVISQAQIANIYNELHKFVISHEAHIRCSNYQLKIERIQEQIKLFKNIELVLELYLLTRDKVPTRTLSKFLTGEGLVDNQGVFVFSDNNTPLFTVSAEDGRELEAGSEYNKLAIVSKLHLHANPIAVVDKIFDFGERFMTQFESRMLSTNQQVLTQREFDQLYNYVKNYKDSAEKKQIKLGSSLIKRIF